MTENSFLKIHKEAEEKMFDLAQKTMAVERLRPECVMCVCNKYIQKYPDDVSESRKVEYMQRVFSLMASAPKTTAVPVIVRDIDIIRKEMFGQTDDYTKIKWHFNELLLGQIDGFRERIARAADPLRLSMQLALIGNYIDFAAVDHVDETYLEQLLHEADGMELDEGTYNHMKKDLAQSSNLVYLTDNCGEIVMDRLFIEQILKYYPNLTISVIVRGQDAANDATMEDAVQVGLDQIARVVDNGNDIMGTWFPEISEEAALLVKRADMMISKGQANFETMRHCKLNTYYLFLCKCEMFANMFHVPQFTGMLLHENDVRNSD